MDKAPKVNLQSTAHYFLEGLNELGIEHLFCNFGTDHAPLIEEMARWQRTGRSFPNVLSCPHENTAMHMAAGYALVTGRGQAVMVHVDAGTANAVMGTHNLRRGRTPVVLIAGRAPYTVRGELKGSRDNYVHFIQEPFDQASLVRPYCKWLWTLPSGVVTKEALRRAHSVAHSDPKGPVYLMLARETLAETWDEAAMRSFPEERYGPVAAGAADSSVVAALAERLMQARHPILLTSYSGRNKATPALIDELARFAGIRVFETHPTHLNISRESPCFVGFAPGKHVATADLGLMVDVDVPWIPTDTAENPDTYWAHIDVDVVKEDFPIWGFPNNLRLRGDSFLILGQLLEALKNKATPAFRNAAATRIETIKREHDERLPALAKMTADKGSTGKINPHYLCAELGKAIGADDIVFNEGIRNGPAVMNQIPRTRPGTYFGLAGGALGYSGGSALGAKLASPERNVIHIVGDGAFYFGNPSSVYAVAKKYRLPIFTVVLDNSGWSAVKEATLRVYPDGNAKATDEFHALLAPEMEFGKVAEAAGGYGETVTDPDAVPAAIQRCLKEVRGGRAALMNVRIPKI